jgi:hypothetical protein
MEFIPWYIWLSLMVLFWSMDNATWIFISWKVITKFLCIFINCNTVAFHLKIEMLTS